MFQAELFVRLFLLCVSWRHHRAKPVSGSIKTDFSEDQLSCFGVFCLVGDANDERMGWALSPSGIPLTGMSFESIGDPT